MVIVTTISDLYFELNGLQFAKIYQPLAAGLEEIAIYNVYDTRQQLKNSVKYDQYQIDGATYASQAEAITALLPVIYNGISQSGVIEVLAEKAQADSYGQSYINNYRSRVLDDGAIYFPNKGGYIYGKLKELMLEWNTSILMVHSAVKVGVLYNVKPTGLDFTVVRNSIATYVDENGGISTAAVDTPRIDYSDGDGAVLVEPESENLFPWSEDFSQAAWSKTAATITSNATLSPNGDLTADKLIATSANTVTHSVADAIVLPVNDVYTFSAFFKKGEYNFGQLRFGSSSANGCVFDLENGSIAIKGASVTAEITPFANGWYRCSIAKTLTAATNSFMVAVNESGDFAGWAGDDTSGIYIANAQLELGGITSYIPTAGAAVTREVDAITGAGNVDSFDSEEGTIALRMAALEGGSGTRSISISDGTVSNSIVISYSSVLNQIDVTLKVGGVNQVVFNYADVDVAVMKWIVFRYKLNDFSLWIEKAKVLEDLNGSVSGAGTYDRINLTDPTGAINKLEARVNAIIYVNRYLTDEEIKGVVN